MSLYKTVVAAISWTLDDVALISKSKSWGIYLKEDVENQI
jgi:hypothetical protein